MQFDVRAAKALQAGEHLIVPGAPGLRLEASSAGRAWTYRFKSPTDGRMRQVKIGTWPDMTASEAGVQWERLRRDRDAGIDPAQARREARKATPVRQEPTPADSVGALLDGFAAWATKRRASKGAAELKRTFATMVDDAMRARRPEDVTRSVAYDLITKFARTPVQASNLRRELGAAWEWGHDSGRLADTVPNWWRQILRGKLQSAGKIVGGEHQGQSKRVLSVEEVGAVLRHLPHLSRLPAELVTLYLWTGCRGAELVQIEGREVTEDAAGVLWWLVPKSKLKMSRHPLVIDLPVPLVGRAREIVLARKDIYGAGFLFPPTRGKAKHVDQKVVGVAVWWHMPSCELRREQARARWPVTAWSPHDLRRTVRTQLSRMQCPEDIAEAIIGHVSDVYNRHEYRAERVAWITRLDAAWEAACRR
jgi:integrase